jgi:hypothetical protein
LSQKWSVDQGISLEAIPGELDRYRAFRDRAIADIISDLRTTLRKPDSGGAGKVIQLTSTVSAEGKSTIRKPRQRRRRIRA